MKYDTDLLLRITVIPVPVHHRSNKRKQQDKPYPRGYARICSLRYRDLRSILCRCLAQVKPGSLHFSVKVRVVSNRGDSAADFRRVIAKETVLLFQPVKPADVDVPLRDQTIFLPVVHLI